MRLLFKNIFSSVKNQKGIFIIFFLVITVTCGFCIGAVSSIFAMNNDVNKYVNNSNPGDYQINLSETT